MGRTIPQRGQLLLLLLFLTFLVLGLFAVSANISHVQDSQILREFYVTSSFVHPAPLAPGILQNQHQTQLCSKNDASNDNNGTNDLEALLSDTQIKIQELRRDYQTLQKDHEALKHTATKATARASQLSNTLRKVSHETTKIVAAKIAIPTGIREDDLLSGKACLRDGTQFTCRDCQQVGPNNANEHTTTSSSRVEWELCDSLEPHSPCSAWNVPELDEPWPRRQTHHDEYALHDGLRYSLARFGYRGMYEQFPCLELQDCFDLSRCYNTTDSLKVYIYGPSGEPIEMMLKERLHTVVTLTTSPEEACLLIVTPRSFGKKDYSMLLQSKHWDQGRNHFLFRSHWILDYDIDRFPGNQNFQKAALSGPNFVQGVLRVGYDVPMYYDHPQHPFTVNDTVYELVQNAVHRQRSLLLSFQGTIKPISHWNYHRWLASAYWPQNTTNILVSVRCPSDNVTMSAGMDYVTSLVSSTFAFCPGGRSPGSWRFGEALAMGAIPVVTADFVPPYYPEVDWSGCLIKVNEARIVDIPRIVGMIDKDEVRLRQQRCSDLFQQLIGWTKFKGKWSIDLEGTNFVVSMTLWKLRIEMALRQMEKRAQIESALRVKTVSI